MSRLLITLGLILVVVGLLWPFLQKIGLGHLPGDITVEKENANFYFPVTSSILVSIVVSLLIWLFRR